MAALCVFCTQLHDIHPWTGGKIVGEREIDALLIQPGDILKVIPRTKILADGLVVWGSSYVNESMVTGESDPVLKEASLSVIGGTINLHGLLQIQANKVRSNTILSQIISLVETAQMSKAPIQNFADFIASIFVPAVVTLASFTLLGWYLAGILGAYPKSGCQKLQLFRLFPHVRNISCRNRIPKCTGVSNTNCSVMVEQVLEPTMEFL